MTKSVSQDPRSWVNTATGGLIVAVDGPSGCGKSTVCRTVAGQLGARYLDTGAMYRVATLHVLQQGIIPDGTNEEQIIAATREIPFVISDDPQDTAVLLAGKDVSGLLRGPEVTKHVSAVSAIGSVRENLVALQRRLAAQAGRCIVEGRDIGTVVLQDAPIKIYLTASSKVRAERRTKQDLQAGRQVDFAAVLADIERRDLADSSRALSPLKPAADAIEIDTSELSFAEVTAQVMALIERSCQ